MVIWAGRGGICARGKLQSKIDLKTDKKLVFIRKISYFTIILTGETMLLFCFQVSPDTE